MANPIKYTSTTQENSINTGNFAIGVNKGGYGPTNLTNFYNGKTPNIGGYTVYVSNSETASPSIFMANNDEGLITLSNQLGGSGITTITAALNFFNASTTMLCTNNMDYPNIVTDGLVLNLDAAFTPSYPKNGTTWKDLSGNGNNGTLVNGVSYNGDNGGNLSFDGVNDYTDLGNVLNLGTNSMTICSWIKLNTNYETSQNPIVSKTRATSQNFRFAFRVLATKRLGAFFQGNSLPDIIPYGDTEILANQWYFLTAIFNRSSNIELYVNTRKEVLTNNATISQWSSLNFQSINPFRIGATTAIDNISLSSVLNGNISSIQLYHKVLTPQEILQNYYAGLQRLIPTDGLVLSLDAQNTNRRISNPTIAYDMSGNGYDGTMMNGTSLSTDGGTSFSFDGVDDYIQLTNTWMWELGYCINIWIDLSNSEGTSKYFLGNNTTSFQGVRYNSTSQSFLVFNGAGGYLEISYPKPNTWIMFTAKRLTSTLYECYVNGISIGNNNAGTSGATIQLNVIGKRGDGYPTDSKISSVTFYNRELTNNEISIIYNATRSRYGL